MTNFFFRFLQIFYLWKLDLHIITQFSSLLWFLMIVVDCMTKVWNTFSLIQLWLPTAYRLPTINNSLAKIWDFLFIFKVRLCFGGKILFINPPTHFRDSGDVCGLKNLYFDLNWAWCDMWHYHRWLVL